jgi:hypothetical protein
MVRLLLGEFSFLDEQNDGEYKAIIHRIDKVINCENEDKASELGDEMLDEFESYLVPTSYNGKIDMSELEPMSKYFAESSYDFEDKDKEHIVIVSVIGDDESTETVATIEGIENLQAIKDLLKYITKN